jgi:predicted dehydrogenase
MSVLSSLRTRKKKQPRHDAVRVALAGLGEAAHGIHLPALAQLDQVRLVAGADPNVKARSQFEGAHKLPVYADALEMIERERPDWVVVATPPAYHLPVCLAAMARGAHVFCEKPLVESVSDGRQLLAAEREHGRHVVVNHEFAAMPIFACARELVSSGQLGELLFLQFWEHQLEIPHGGEDWRSQCLTMREFGTHVVDLAVQIYGAFPERLYARMARSGGPAGSDLIDVVTLDFPGGRLASIVLDRVCRGPHRYLEMRADGSKASLRASFGGRADVQLGLDAKTRKPRVAVDLALGGQAWLERGAERKIVARNSSNPFADATARHFAQALVAVAHGREPPVSAAYALEVSRLVEAAYESARSGAPVTFNETSVWRATCPT